MNLTHIIDDIKNIASTHNNPCIVYVGIGTQAGRIEIDGNGIKSLSEEHYHQFPLTLKELYMKYKNLQIFIILIDPHLEKDIYMVNDMNLINMLFNGMNWIKNDLDTGILERYTNDRINLYAVRESVVIERNPINEYNYTNITDNIRSLHTLCIDMNILYLYHNFTGANIRSIYSIFGDEIKDHLNTIIYGLGNGYNEGCYVDLRQNDAKLPHAMLNDKNRPYLYVYNIDCMYKYYDNYMQFIEDTYEMFGDSMIETIEAINKKMIDKFKYDFNNYIFSYLRHAYNFMKEPHSDYNDDYILQPFNRDESNYIHNLYKMKDVDIFKKIKDFIATYYIVNIKFILAHTKYDMYSSHHIIDMITMKDNVYSWGEEFKKIFG